MSKIIKYNLMKAPLSPKLLVRYDKIGTRKLKWRETFNGWWSFLKEGRWVWRRESITLKAIYPNQPEYKKAQYGITMVMHLKAMKFE